MLTVVGQSAQRGVHWHSRRAVLSMRHWLTSHLLQGQRRRSGQGATLEHLRAQSALLTLVLADGGVVHHGQKWVFSIPQTGENVLKQSKPNGGMNERKAVSCSAVRPQMLPSVQMHSCRLFICSRLMQPKSHYAQHGWTRSSLSAGLLD